MNGNSFLIHTTLATAQCTGRVTFCWLELTDKPVGAWARESLRRISIEILFREMLRPRFPPDEHSEAMWGRNRQEDEIDVVAKEKYMI